MNFFKICNYIFNYSYLATINALLSLAVGVCSV
jgi:hypothetical protein